MFFNIGVQNLYAYRKFHRTSNRRHVSFTKYRWIWSCNNSRTEGYLCDATWQEGLNYKLYHSGIKGVLFILLNNFFTDMMSMVMLVNGSQQQ